MSNATHRGIGHSGGCSHRVLRAAKPRGDVQVVPCFEIQPANGQLTWPHVEHIFVRQHRKQQVPSSGVGHAFRLAG